jgi:hypothetical protein
MASPTSVAAAIIALNTTLRLIHEKDSSFGLKALGNEKSTTLRELVEWLECTYNQITILQNNGWYDALHTISMIVLTAMFPDTAFSLNTEPVMGHVYHGVVLKKSLTPYVELGHKRTDKKLIDAVQSGDGLPDGCNSLRIEWLPVGSSFVIIEENNEEVCGLKDEFIQNE